MTCKYFEPTSEIKYGFYLNIPENIKKAQILLWGHGSTPPNLSYDEICEFVKPSFENIVNFADGLNLIVVMPILPRLYGDNSYPSIKVDSQIMTKEVMLNNYKEVDSFYKNPDLEILKILDFIKAFPALNQVNLLEKIITGGISAGATFTNRFNILHPQIVQATITLSSGIFTYPTKELEKVSLNYPFGINNLDKIEGITFDGEAYSKISQFLYVGGQDNKPENDILLFELIEENESSQISTILGGNSLERTIKFFEFIKDFNKNNRLLTLNGVGHQVPKEVYDELNSWLKSVIN